MTHHRPARRASVNLLAIACCLLLPLTGCMVPATQLGACRAQSQQTAERNKVLEAELANATAHIRRVEADRDRMEAELDQTERELVALDQQRRQ